MNKIKMILMLILVASFYSTLASAGDGNTLYCYFKSLKRPMRLSLDDLNKLTFSDNGIQMWKKYGMEEIGYDDFLLFTFAEIEHPYISDVEPVFMKQDLRVRFLNDRRLLIIESDQMLQGVIVCDTQGRTVDVNSTAATSYRVNMSSVPKGIYVVKAVCNGKMVTNKVVL